MGQGAHSGSAVGKNHCTLPHSNTCPGGIVGDESWRACPPEYEQVPDEGFTLTMNMSDFGTSTPYVSPGLNRNLLTPNTNGLHSSQQARQYTAGSGALVSNPTSSSQVSQQSTTPPVYTTPPTPPPLPAAVSSSVAVSVIAPAPSSIPGSHLTGLENEMGRLSIQQRHGGALGNLDPQLDVNQHIQKQVVGLRAANQQVTPISHSIPGTLNIANLRALTSLQQDVDNQWQVLRDCIPALQPAPTATSTLEPHQVLGSAGRSVQHREVGEPVTNPRAPQPHVQVIQGLGNVQQRNQDQIPRAQLSYPGYNPSLSPALTVLDATNMNQPVYHAKQSIGPYHSLTQGSQFIQPHQMGQQASHPSQVVKGIGQIPQQTQPTIPLRQPVHILGSQFAQSQQVVQQVIPPSQAAGAMHQPIHTNYKREFRCSPKSGRVFEVLVPVPVQSNPLQCSPVVQYEWRCDPTTGETYQVPVKNPTPKAQLQFPSQHCQPVIHQVPTHAEGQLPVVASLPVYEQQQSSVTYPWNKQSQVIQQGTDQLPGRAHLQLAQTTEASGRIKGISELCDRGATKDSKVIDISRKCPVKWAKLAKPDNINLPLYSYGAVTELESALSGRGDPITHDVLLAKINHLKNVFEVCCLNSNQTDFSNYGWTIARDYAFKVEEEVEQRFVAWHDMPPGIRTQTLVLSQMEHPRTSVKKKLDDSIITKKDRCTTFNTCTTEMKCSYEVSNPGRTCIKKHECSWCRANLQQSYKHQEWKCQKKAAATQ